MRNLRRFEAACGLVTALVGCLALAFTLFGPVYSFHSCTGNGTDISSCQTGTANLLQIGIQPLTLVALGILLLGLIGVAVSAVVHGRTGASGWRIVLWASTAVIVMLTCLTVLSIGLFLLPSTLFALLASALSLGVRRAGLG
jgi:hypothetical protein